MKNWFVIYPPGSGGNHLANLLSLSEGFERRFTDDTYTNSSKNAHIEGIDDLDPQHISLTLDKLTQQNNIFCGHLVEYHRLTQQSYFENFTNRTIFLIQFPDYDTQGYHRIENHNGGKLPRWLYSETALLYNNVIFKQICNEPESTKCYHIDTNKLFNKSLDQVFSDLIRSGTVKLDFNLAQDLHTLWLKKLYPEDYT